MNKNDQKEPNEQILFNTKTMDFLLFNLHLFGSLKIKRLDCCPQIFTIQSSVKKSKQTNNPNYPILSYPNNPKQRFKQINNQMDYLKHLKDLENQMYLFYINLRINQSIFLRPYSLSFKFNWNSIEILLKFNWNLIGIPFGGHAMVGSYAIAVLHIASMLFVLFLMNFWS